MVAGRLRWDAGGYGKMICTVLKRDVKDGCNDGVILYLDLVVDTRTRCFQVV